MQLIMTPQNIADAVNKLLLIDVRVKSRKIDYVKSRALYYHVCRMTNDRWSLIAIGKEVGVDHATVIHGAKMFAENYSVYYPKLKDYADFLINHFKRLKANPKKGEDVDRFMILKSENELLKTEIAFLKQEKKSSLGERIDDLLKIAPHRELIEERLNAIIFMESKKVYL